MKKPIRPDWKAVVMVGVVVSMVFLSFWSGRKAPLVFEMYVQQAVQPGLPNINRQAAVNSLVPYDSTVLLFFPNPVKSTLHVVVPRKPSDFVWLGIYQMDGQLLKKYAIETGRVIELNVQLLPQGTYLVRAGDRQGRKWSGKFFKAP